MTKIADLHALEILDSRGNPTLRVTARDENGVQGSACVPSGASTGAREALELRDGDASRYGGKGVLRAVAGVNGELRDLLLGKSAQEQADIDRLMREADGTGDKSRLGANAILGASLAVAHLAAAAQKKPLYEHIGALFGGASYSLPRPMMNILNGGAHASNNVDIQEFMVQPVAPTSFAESLRWGAEVFYSLKGILHSRGLSTAVGDEGGFAPDLPSNAAALDALVEAIERAGFSPGRDLVLALDCASSEFYSEREKSYRLAGEGRVCDAGQFVEYLGELCAQYPIASVEDGLAEDDWEGWKALTQSLGGKVQLVGDDLFVTDSATLQRGIDGGVGNAILIKLNQIGTLSETLEVIQLAQANKYHCVISHRSGETEDVTIADLAVGTGAGQIKTGAPCRSDRVAKYNRLLVIEDEGKGIPCAR